jgi:hypothetical protein
MYEAVISAKLAYAVGDEITRTVVFLFKKARMEPPYYQ